MIGLLWMTGGVEAAAGMHAEKNKEKIAIAANLREDSLK